MSKEGICAHPKCSRKSRNMSKCAEHLGVVRCYKCNRWAWSGGLCDTHKTSKNPSKMGLATQGFIKTIKYQKPMDLLAGIIVKVEAMSDVATDEVSVICPEYELDKIGMLTDAASQSEVEAALDIEMIKVKLEPMD